MAEEQFDLIIIGAGPGGYVAALRAAQLGLSVAIVERENLGGICLNWGCIPTKAMLRSAELYHLMHRAAEFGLTAEGVGFDLPAIVARSRQVAGQLSSGVAHLLKKARVRVLRGTARFIGPHVLEIADDGEQQRVTADHIIVATGARARFVAGLEADGQRVWDYRTALNPPFLPERLLVVGSGAIGIEFASFYNAFGADTTVVELAERILPAEDAEISGLARKAFEKQGMHIHTGAQVTGLERLSDGVLATIQSGSDSAEIVVDAVISAVGITGNIENVGLEEIGVTTERGHVVVDEMCRTSVAGIYAIGDVAAPPWLAHKASHEGVMVAELVAGGAPHPVRADAIPGCTYCHPQIASVGLTEAQALDAGREVRIGRFPYIGNGKAIALGEPEGLIKTVFDARTGELLGAHMIGAEVTELIQGYAIGRTLEATEAEFMATVFPHPTLSEAMHESVLAAFGKALHI